jgi:DNA-binding PadR family transcriptional regulator
MRHRGHGRDDRPGSYGDVPGRDLPGGSRRRAGGHGDGERGGRGGGHRDGGGERGERGERGSRRHGERSGRGERGSRRGARGDVRAAILALLDERPMHGYEMLEELSRRTQELWRPSPGSLYPALQLLEDQGLVQSITADGRRRFELTEAGRADQAERLAAPRPWEAMVGTADQGAIALRRAMRAVEMAVSQVAEAGTAAQQTRAESLLTELRRRLYLLLADVPEGGGGESGAGEGGAGEGGAGEGGAAGGSGAADSEAGPGEAGSGEAGSGEAGPGGVSGDEDGRGDDREGENGR